MSPTSQRVIGGLVLLAAGMLSLPLAAAAWDGEGAENWIMPIQLLAMAGVGAGTAVGLPALARSGAPAPRRALVGAGWGVLAAVVGVVLFWLLISGLRGA